MTRIKAIMKPLGLSVLALSISACAALGGQQPKPAVASPPMKHKTMSVNGNPMPHAGSEAPTPTNKAARTQQQADADNAMHASFEAECQKRVAMADKFLVKSEDGTRVTHVKVGATGYGAPPKNYYPEGQRRLMTIRASKIDAYRALAEVVGGLHIWGGSSIGDMVIERDRYRVFVDTYVRGARVMSVSSLEDGTYKTVVEMHVDQRFLSQVMAFIDPLLAQCLKGEAKDNFAFYGSNAVAPTFYYSE